LFVALVVIEVMDVVFAIDSARYSNERPILVLALIFAILDCDPCIFLANMLENSVI
jgi:predicted tellurium resistance membrane protein TerC